MTATVTDVRRHAGIAGQFSISAIVTYPGEPSRFVEFVGSTYGGPVMFASSEFAQVFVTRPERFGAFGIDWVRRFFA